MRSQIPSFRLPEGVIDSEVDPVLNMGVEPRFGKEITSLKSILDEDFDAVLVGTGAPNGRPLDLPGLDEAGDHVKIGINWLAGVTFEHIDEAPKRVVVLGGGNTAMDCTRTALRLGAKEVKAVVRSSYDEMKSSPWEREDAVAEAISIIPNHTPLRYVIEDGKFIGVEFDRVETQWDKGKRRLISTGEDPVLIECDWFWSRLVRMSAFPGSNAIWVFSLMIGAWRWSIVRRSSRPMSGCFLPVTPHLVRRISSPPWRTVIRLQQQYTVI